MTICDCVEKSLKKGRGTEQAAAAQLPPLLCVQLGAGDASEEICKALKPILSVIAHDNSVLPTARAKVCIFIASSASAFLINFLNLRL